jgi:hypothetical protein
MRARVAGDGELINNNNNNNNNINNNNNNNNNNYNNNNIKYVITHYINYSPNVKRKVIIISMKITVTKL